MSQTLILSPNVTQIKKPTCNTLCDQERDVSRGLLLPSEATVSVGRSSIFTAILSTLLLRIASRTSFVLLGFYLGEQFTSVTIVALVLEAFYITELALAPIVGSLSDRLGHKFFLFSAPILGSLAALCFAVVALLFPQAHTTLSETQMVVLLLSVLLGRLLEGVATALNVPSSLGYITAVTSSSDKLRTRVMTAFEVATVAGLALAIPFGGKVSSLLGTWGFSVVIALHLINCVLIACLLKEHAQHPKQTSTHHSLTESLSLLRNKRIFTFLPAWLSINALVGAWMTLITIMLVYPEPAAHLRHPGQLLYGGFSQEFATLLVGGFGLLFLAGMGLWMLVLPRLRRTTVMFIGIGGLNVSIFGLTLINGLADNPAHVPDSSRVLLLFLLILVVLGVLLLSGFTPSSLTHLAAISELLPGKRGSVMGLYSVVMGIGQLLGASLGGLFVDLGGFYGLMVFSVALGLISLGSVLYIRENGHDLIKSKSSNSWSTSSKLPSYDVSKPKVLGKIHRMPVMSDNTRIYTLHRENEKYPYDEDTGSALFGTHGKTVFGTKGKIDGKRMIRLLLVDDQSIVRQGLRMRLSLEPDIVVVGEASNGEQAIELTHALSPDIVLMDVEMPGMDGISTTADLHATSTQIAVVMMSIHDDAQTRARAQAAGAAAFITKSGIFEELLTTVRHIVEINGRACNS